MRLGKRTITALTGAAIAMVAPGQAEAAAILRMNGEVVTDPNGNANAVIPLSVYCLSCRFAIQTQPQVTAKPRLLYSFLVEPYVPDWFEPYVKQGSAPVWKVFDGPNAGKFVQRVSGGHFMPPKQFPGLAPPGKRAIASFISFDGAFLDIAGPANSNVKYSVVVTAVPEPSTWSLLILGFGGIGAAMRRRASARRVTARVSYSQ